MAFMFSGQLLWIKHACLIRVRVIRLPGGGPKASAELEELRTEAHANRKLLTYFAVSEVREACVCRSALLMPLAIPSVRRQSRSSIMRAT
jgi:hypothetical protein